MFFLRVALLKVLNMSTMNPYLCKTTDAGKVCNRLNPPLIELSCVTSVFQARKELKEHDFRIREAENLHGICFISTCSKIVIFYNALFVNKVLESLYFHDPTVHGERYINLLFQYFQPLSSNVFEKNHSTSG